jgi:hypothetical protein
MIKHYTNKVEATEKCNWFHANYFDFSEDEIEDPIYSLPFFTALNGISIYTWCRLLFFSPLTI